MRNFLAELIPKKRNEINKLKANLELPQRPPSRSTACFPFQLALHPERLHIIAEVKPVSPTAGILNSGMHLSTLVRDYSSFASAISVLTDDSCFGGGFDLLHQIVSQTTLPVMCKDFIIDEFQIHAAQRFGASAVLLIARLLKHNVLVQFYQLALNCGMTPIVEIHSLEDLSALQHLPPSIVLINNRNLETLDVSLQTTVRLAPLIDSRHMVVSGSGIACQSTLQSLQPYASRFLIGTALMKSSPLKAELTALTSTQEIRL